MTLILYGIITEQSIGKLFLAGLIPGTLIALFFIVIIYGWAKIDPKIAPRSERSTWKARVRTLPEIMWVLIVFFMVVGGIMAGFFTPSEGAAVGTFALLVLAFVVGLAATMSTPDKYHGDEAFYTVAAIRMCQSGDYWTPYWADGTMRLRKPILTSWTVAGSFHLLSRCRQRARFVLSAAL